MSQFASTLYPQTNPTNPILLKFRERDGIGGFPVHYWAWRLGKGDLPVGVIANGAHIEHAREVLSRLARLTG